MDGWSDGQRLTYSRRRVGVTSIGPDELQNVGENKHRKGNKGFRRPFVRVLRRGTVGMGCRSSRIRCVIMRNLLSTHSSKMFLHFKDMVTVTKNTLKVVLLCYPFNAKSVKQINTYKRRELFYKLL